MLHVEALDCSWEQISCRARVLHMFALCGLKTSTRNNITLDCKYRAGWGGRVSQHQQSSTVWSEKYDICNDHTLWSQWSDLMITNCERIVITALCSLPGCFPPVSHCGFLRFAMFVTKKLDREATLRNTSQHFAASTVRRLPPVAVFLQHHRLQNNPALALKQMAGQ